MKDVFEELEVEVAQNVVDRKHDAIERKNLLIVNDNLIVECLSKEVFSVATNSELNVARFTEMHVANTIIEARCLELEAELANLRDKSHHDNQEELINRFYKLEHYKELYYSIKITRTKHIDQVTALTTENVNLKAQILEKVNSISKDHVKPKVLARGKYAIDVEPIIPRLKNNRDAHIDYLRHLKESVETIRDIVEEAKVVRPLDRSIVSACRYTKHSQELLEYAIGTCPPDSQQRDKQLAHITLIRKNQVIFAKPSDKHQLWRPTIHLLQKTRYSCRLVISPCLWTGSVREEESLNLNLKDLKGPAFKIIKFFHPNVIHLQYQMEECHKLLTDSVDDSILKHNVTKPLPLGGPPGQVTIQSEFLFNKDLKYLRFGSKGSRPALLISKMKAAYYPDAGLEQIVPDQMWIEKECHYDIAAIAVKTHMRILSVARIKFFSMCRYDYMKKIVIRRADLNEHLVIRQRVEDFQLGIESYQTQLNLTKPRWDAAGFKYKHDYTVINSLRSVTFRDRYGVQMIMRFNEIHKFNYGTLQQIDEALDYRVKEFKINRMNPGLNTRRALLVDESEMETTDF
nr:hypothetical protein [Tanacetum cinerariifolium]